MLFHKYNAHTFEEHDKAPSQLSGDMVLRELDSHTHTFGRLNNDNRNLPYNWKKRSIFLSYHIGKEIYCVTILM